MRAVLAEDSGMVICGAHERKIDMRKGWGVVGSEEEAQSEDFSLTPCSREQRKQIGSWWPMGAKGTTEEVGREQQREQVREDVKFSVCGLWGWLEIHLGRWGPFWVSQMRSEADSHLWRMGTDVLERFLCATVSWQWYLLCPQPAGLTPGTIWTHLSFLLSLFIVVWVALCCCCCWALSQLVLPVPYSKQWAREMPSAWDTKGFLLRCITFWTTRKHPHSPRARPEICLVLFLLLLVRWANFCPHHNLPCLQAWVSCLPVFPALSLLEVIATHMQMRAGTGQACHYFQQGEGCACFPSQLSQ